MSTKQHIEEFYKRKHEIEDYIASKNQIVPTPSANVAIQKERVMVELIHNGKPFDTKTAKLMNSTVIDNVPSTGKQPTVDRMIS